MSKHARSPPAPGLLSPNERPRKQRAVAQPVPPKKKNWIMAETELFELAIREVGTNSQLLQQKLAKSGIHVTPEQIRNKLRTHRIQTFLGNNVHKLTSLSSETRAAILAHLATHSGTTPTQPVQQVAQEDGDGDGDSEKNSDDEVADADDRDFVASDGVEEDAPTADLPEDGKY
jgi:hypothetical protein